MGRIIKPVVRPVTVERNPPGRLPTSISGKQEGHFLAYERYGPKTGAKKPVETTVEPTPETWSPDDVVQASLSLGDLRGAIDTAKAAADKLHRARKCPDRMLATQIEELGRLTRNLEAAVVGLSVAVAEARIALHVSRKAHSGRA